MKNPAFKSSSLEALSIFQRTLVQGSSALDDEFYTLAFQKLKPFLGDDSDHLQAAITDVVSRILNGKIIEPEAGAKAITRLIQYPLVSNTTSQYLSKALPASLLFNEAFTDIFNNLKLKTTVKDTEPYSASIHRLKKALLTVLFLDIREHCTSDQTSIAPANSAPSSASEIGPTKSALEAGLPRMNSRAMLESHLGISLSPKPQPSPGEELPDLDCSEADRHYLASVFGIQLSPSRRQTQEVTEGRIDLTSSPQSQPLVNQGTTKISRRS